MSIGVQWDDETRTTVRLDYTQPWTWLEFDRAVLETVALVTSVTHVVDVISNTPPQLGFPVGFPLRHFQRALKLLPKNVGWIVVVSDNPIVRAINSAFF